MARLEVPEQQEESVLVAQRVLRGQQVSQDPLVRPEVPEPPESREPPGLLDQLVLRAEQEPVVPPAVPVLPAVQEPRV